MSKPEVRGCWPCRPSCAKFRLNKKKPLPRVKLGEMVRPKSYMKLRPILSAPLILTLPRPRRLLLLLRSLKFLSSPYLGHRGEKTEG